MEQIIISLTRILSLPHIVPAVFCPCRFSARTFFENFSFLVAKLIVTKSKVRSHIEKRKGDTMIYQLKRKIGATSVLLTVGFSISFTAVLIGISSVNSALIAMRKTGQTAPIYDTMKQTGMSLAISIYAFSVINCLVVTNY